MRIGATSTAVSPQKRTEQATLQVRAGGGVVTLPVAVTITDAPFLQTSDTSVLFRFPGDTSSQSISVWLPNAKTTLPLTTASNSSWLSTNPAGGAGYTDLNIQVNPANLSTGDYFGFVTLSASDAINSPVDIPVRMVIVPLAMWSQPPSFTFSQAAGGPGPAAQNLAILATGPPVSFTLTTDVSWLSTVPASGETSANIAVTANGHGLAPGIYHGNVTASGPGATPLIVPVTLTIEPENFLTLEPHDFDFFYWPGIGFVDQVNSADMNVTGSRTLKWTAVKSPDDWFYFANYTTNGATPYRFVIGIAWASLNNSGPVPIGTFSGAITITSPEATNSPQIATLHGYSLPAAPLSISKTSVSFQSQQADPPPSIVSVSALSPTMFTVSVPRPNSWLSVSQSADATPATVTFTVKTSSLPAGSYSETVALYVQQNDGPPIPMHINVTLFVAR